MSQNEFSKKVLGTAFGVAFRRTFTGIPFSKEVFAKLKVLMPDWNQEKLDTELVKPLIPYFEARYLMTDKVLREVGETNGIRQVAEIAAGLSMRGALYVAGNLGRGYLEIDQKEMIDLKWNILQSLIGEIGQGGLTLSAGDGLDMETLRKALSYLNPKDRIAVINEGFMVYLGHKGEKMEKQKYADNVMEILTSHGGAGFRNNVWITPDIAIKGAIDYPGRRAVEKQWHASVGRDLSENFFDTEDAARNLYESRGFVVERRSLNEVRSEMKSPEILGLSEDIVQGVIGKSPLFVMRAA